MGHPAYWAKRGTKLLKWPQEFQPKEAHITGSVLTQNPGRNRGSLTWNYARWSGRGGWNGEMNNLIRAENMCRGDTSPGGADIQSFRQFHEFGTRKVGGPQENGNLEADSRRAASWGVVQALAFLHKLSLQIFSHSTTELVRG